RSAHERAQAGEGGVKAGVFRNLIFGLVGIAGLLHPGGPAHAAEPAPAAEIPTPYLPSTPVAVEEMLRLADVKPSDVVLDLGSGDGRIPITAALAFGARGRGVDIDPVLVAQANEK